MILAAAAAAVLAGCAKIETNEVKPVLDENVPIAFTNYAPKAITKADADNYASSTILVNGAEFDVYGWSTDNGTSFNGSNGTAFMSWYTVTYKTDGNSDGTKNAYPDGYRYWPSGDAPDYLSFYAYYPSNAGTITPPTGLGAFSFTAEAAAADQVDFMVADVVKDQVYDNTNSGTDGTVNLTFRHMLTKVQVKFKTTAAVVADTNTDVKITSAKFYKINNTGTLTSSYNGTAFGTAWSAQSGTATYDVYFPTDALTATASDVADANVFLMVPQTMLVNTNTNAQYLEIKWTVTTSGVTIENSKKLYLDDCVTTDGGNTAANIDWEKNNFVTYTITVGPQPILFTAEVEGWDDVKNGYYNVQ